MSATDFGSLLLLLFLIVGLAHLLGNLSSRLGQPRVIGEILAGILLGSAILGRFAPAASTWVFPAAASTASSRTVVIGFLYNFGLLLLMFCSGTEIKLLFDRSERKQVLWLTLVGTGLPFALILAAAPILPIALLIGSAGKVTPLVLIIAMACAVTSIPVISKIMHDLDIMQTRFARIVLSVAVIEDIVLWAILAAVIPLAKAGAVSSTAITIHIGVICLYLAAGLFVMPKVLGWLGEAEWNTVARSSPIAYVFVVLLAYSAIAAALDINLVFAAFLAGFGVMSHTNRFADASKTISGFSFAVFIPIYFAIVGYKLDFTRTFSLTLLVSVLAIACVIKLFSAGLGARIAGFNRKESVNLSMALNARGGPGIVLASVAFDAGIINPAFYTTLILVAILTSQMAGVWLSRALRLDGGNLLGPEAQKLPAGARLGNAG